MFVNGNVLTANQSNANYQWIDCDNGNSNIDTETSQTYIANQSGNYAVEINDGVCIVNSSCTEIISLGVEESELNQINIYPNPTIGKVYFNNQNQVKIIYTIMNVQGKVIEIKESSSDQDYFDLSSYASGTYIIEVKNGTSVKQYKIIKK